MVAPSVLDGHISVDASGTVSASSNPTNFVVHGSPQDVLNYARQGNDLVVEMNGGRTITIKGFAEHGFDFHNLVFSQGQTISIVDLSPAVTSVGDGIVESLILVETIGASSSVAALLGIIGAVGAAGGVALGAGGNDEPKTEEEGNTTAPAAPVLITVIDDVAPLSGAITSGQLTNDNRPAFEGNGGVLIFAEN